MVKLIVNKGSTCPDSITRIVKIFPDFEGEYSFSGLYCPNSPFQFIDLSTSTYGPVSFWNWDFGDAQFSTSRNTSHSYSVGGVYNVSLISGNAKGCRDTTIKTLDVEKFMPDAGNDTIIVKGEHLDFHAKGGISYYWTPAENLNSVSIADPVGRFPEEGYFRYNVHVTSMNQCEGDDSIIVRVVGQASQFVPNAFTPNGDGVNDIFRPRAVGYRSVEFFRVFNRFGEMVYESKDFEEGWDGRYKGNNADIGTYMYVLQMTDRFGKPETVRGDVILMR
jgi:gliding motility-associated-like protein